MACAGSIAVAHDNDDDAGFCSGKACTSYETHKQCHTQNSAVGRCLVSSYTAAAQHALNPKHTLARASLPQLIVLLAMY